MITGAQIRAGRALLDWHRQTLADASGVSHSAIADFERGRTESILTSSAAKIIAAFDRAGVELFDADKNHGAGVRFKRPEIE
jgi:transcriptional regulator with XRE-family HTH domain